MVKSFTIFEEYYDLITLLSEEEQGHVLLAIVRYMFEDKEMELNERESKVFVNLKRPLKTSKEQSKRRTKKEPEENRKETETKPKDKPRENTYILSMSMSNVNVYKEIIDYLNNKTNSDYKYTSSKTQSLIKARINEGFKIEDFKKVIDKKTDEWLENEKMNVYLRPQTLFGTNFESYLNQKETAKKVPDWFNKEQKKVEVSEADKKELDDMLEEFK